MARCDCSTGPRISLVHVTGDYTKIANCYRNRITLFLWKYPPAKCNLRFYAGENQTLISELSGVTFGELLFDDHSIDPRLVKCELWVSCPDSSIYVTEYFGVCECVCRHDQASQLPQSGQPQNLSISPYAASDLRSYDSQFQETTPEHFYELESAMATFPQYTYNYQHQQILTSLAHVLFFPGNQRRMTLIVDCPDSMTFGIADSNVGTVLNSHVIGNGPTTVVMPYRDYGPFIRGPIYIAVQAVGGRINATEIIEVG